MRDEKIPVWKTIKHAFGGVASTAREIGWQPVIAFVLIFGISELIGFMTTFIHGRDVASQMFSVTAQIQAIILTLVWFIALAPFGISIHRSVLLFEKPTEGYFKTILRKRSMRFALTGYAFYFFALLFPMLFYSAAFTNVLPEYFIFIGFVWMLSAGFFLARVCILLPAIAVEAQLQKIGEAWNATRGNTWRIWFGIVVVWLPFYAFQRLVEKVNQANAQEMAILVLSDLVVSFVVCVQILTSIRFVSLIYKDRTT